MWIPTSEGKNSAVNPDFTFPVTFTGMSSVGPGIKIVYTNYYWDIIVCRILLKLLSNFIWFINLIQEVHLSSVFQVFSHLCLKGTDILYRSLIILSSPCMYVQITETFELLKLIQNFFPYNIRIFTSHKYQFRFLIKLLSLKKKKRKNGAW